MAALDIVEVVPLATMRVAIRFTTNDAAGYTVTAVENAHTTTATGTTGIIIVGPLKVRQSYSITVTDGVTTGAAHVQTFDPEVSHGMILRQKIADIINIAAFSTLRVVTDAYSRPRYLRTGDGVTTGITRLEIAQPQMIQSEVSGIRNVEVYDVGLSFIEFGDDEDKCGDKNSFQFERVKKLINSKKNLQLLGVIDDSWGWLNGNHIPDLEDNYVSFDVTLRVRIQTISDAMPYEYRAVS